MESPVHWHTGQGCSVDACMCMCACMCISHRFSVAPPPPSPSSTSIPFAPSPFAFFLPCCYCYFPHLATSSVLVLSHLHKHFTLHAAHMDWTKMDIRPATGRCRHLLSILLLSVVVNIIILHNPVHAVGPTPNNNNMQPQPQLAPQQNAFSRATNEILLDLRQQMITKAIKFDEHFRTLLSNSKVSLHNMFAETYGMLYEHNTEIFTGMFESLEQYYANGQVKLTKQMESFFERLYQKIFQVMNNSRAFTPSYLECATEQLAHLKPFKDVPDKLITGIRHVFVAARTFVQALNMGIDVIKNIISLGQTTQCTNLINEKLLKNINNPQGSVGRLPCLNFCEQVIARCFGKGHLEELNEKWRGYVLALNELAKQLRSSYNIETTIDPLGVQISEAIMNFQENGHNITQQVFQACGRASPPISDQHMAQLKPSLSRRGRRAVPMPISAATALNSDHTRHQPLAGMILGTHMRAVTPDGLPPKLSLVPTDLTPQGKDSPRLIDEIKNYMLSTRSFWSTLPNTVCTSNHTLGSNVTNLSKKPNCFHEPFNGISDINSDVRYRVEIQQQVKRLDALREKIEGALKGIEVDWSFGIDQRPTVVSNVNGRLPLITTTSTTTTTTPEPFSDDSEDNDDMITENGSGEDEEHTEYPPDDLEDLDHLSSPGSLDTEDNFDDTDNVDDSSLSPLDTTTQANPIIDNQDNTIDLPLQPISEDTQTNLITPPNQPGAQRSSETSSKLVIRNEGHLLFASLMTVVLLFVSNSHNIRLVVYI